MSKQDSKIQQTPGPQDADAPGAESADVQAALARFASILEKAAVPPAKDDESSPEKPAH